MVGATTFQCPECKKKYQTPKNVEEGKRLKCGKCRAILIVRKGEIVIDARPENRQLAVKADSTAPVASAPRQAAGQQQDGPTIFLSHSHCDREFVVEHVYQFLTEHGFRPWMCHEDIVSGEQWEQIIDQGLKGCEWFFVVLSPRSVESEWVHKEVVWALENRKTKIIPILMEPCDARSLHLDLTGLQHEDFSQDGRRFRGQRRLIANLLAKLNAERKSRQENIERLRRDFDSLQQEKRHFEEGYNEHHRQIQSALEFDGNWSGPPRGGNADFMPLAERKTPIITVFNLKGGVGKTTLAANLGASLWGAKERHRVLLIDLDYQGSLSRMCLGPETVERLRTRQATSRAFFDAPLLDPDVLNRLVEPVMDNDADGHRGQIVATDEDLYQAETFGLLQWLLQPSLHDVRYRLRRVLHRKDLGKSWDVVLIDCPPRLTAGTINALLASDFVLVPTLLDGTSLEAAPRALKWLAVRRTTLFPSLRILGVIANGTVHSKGPTNREWEELNNLPDKLRDAWGKEVKLFETLIPTFPEGVLKTREFAAHYSKNNVDLKSRFQKLWQEIQAEIGPIGDIRPETR